MKRGATVILEDQKKSTGSSPIKESTWVVAIETSVSCFDIVKSILR